MYMEIWWNFNIIFMEIVKCLFAGRAKLYTPMLDGASYFAVFREGFGRIIICQRMYNQI